LCEDMNDLRLEMMLVELLTVFCYFEDFSVIYNYFRSYLKEYMVILDLISRNIIVK